MSRGFLDIEHETYSVYNAMPWRNNWGRKVYNSQLQAHCGRFGVSSHDSPQKATLTDIFTCGEESVNDSFTIVVPIAAGGNGVVYTIIAKSFGGGSYSSTPGANEVVYSATSTPATRQANLILAINGSSDATKVKGGANYNTSTGIPGITAAAGSTSAKITITATTAGIVGRAITFTDVVGTMVKDGAYGSSPANLGGLSATARVYGSEAPGTIVASHSYIDGDASKHKYHRNNIERVKLIGDPFNDSTAVIITASFHDNGFVSHMIPRTDQQTRWITGSLI